MDLCDVGLKTWCGATGEFTLPETVITPGPDFVPGPAPAAAPASHGALFGALAGIGAAAAIITILTFHERRGSHA